jgi:hypothetical protein
MDSYTHARETKQFGNTLNLRRQQMPSLTNPPGHLRRDKWTALSGPLSEHTQILKPEARKQDHGMDSYTHARETKQFGNTLDKPKHLWEYNPVCKVTPVISQGVVLSEH